MEYNSDVVHRRRVKQQAADALSRICMNGEGKEPLKVEVSCLLMSSEPVSDDALKVPTVCYEGKAETVMVDWCQKEPVGRVLPALLEVTP